jgi:phosphoribosyl-dephospho-CoA transferase
VPDAVAAPGGLRRHHLLWCASAHHGALGAQIADSFQAAAAIRLLAAGAPLVIGRQPATGDGIPGAETLIAAGMPLPPALGKGRLPFRISTRNIIRTAKPPRLADTIPRLPAIWRAPLLRLLCGALSIGIELRLYGSAAWEGLTGLSYLTPRSDIDLLWRPVSVDQLAAGVAFLAEWEAATGIRTDGEILFGDDDAVAWREWLESGANPVPQRVLVKSHARVRMCSRDELLLRNYPDGRGREVAQYALGADRP